MKNPASAGFFVNVFFGTAMGSDQTIHNGDATHTQGLNVNATRNAQLIITAHLPSSTWSPLAVWAAENASVYAFPAD